MRLKTVLVNPNQINSNTVHRFQTRVWEGPPVQLCNLISPDVAK